MSRSSYANIPFRSPRARRALGAFVVVIASFGVVASPALAAGHATSSPAWVDGFWHHHGANGESDVNVCSYAVSPGSVHCNAQVVTDLGKDALAVEHRHSH